MNVDRVAPDELDPEPAWWLVRQGASCWYMGCSVAWPPDRDERPPDTMACPNQSVGYVFDTGRRCRGTHYIPACAQHLQLHQHAHMEGC